MTWFKVDDSFYDHPKVFDLSDAAVSLWVRAGSWSARNLTNGFVPSSLPARLCGDAETAVQELVHRKMWRRTKGGYFFHDWRDYNPTRDDVESGRRNNRERQRKYRERARQGGKRDSVTNASLTRDSQWTDTLSVTHPTRPDPESPNGDSRGGARDRARAAPESARRTARWRAIAACDLCDESGYVGTRVCDHDPDAADRARRGRAMVDAALRAKQNP